MTKIELRMLLVPVLGAAMLAGSGCARNDRAENTGQTTTADAADQQQEKEKYITQMDQRVTELERKLAEVKARTGAQAVPASRVEEIREDIGELQKEIADLRATGPENWWPATRNSVERSWKEVQSDVQRHTGKRPTQSREASDASTTADRTTKEGQDAARDFSGQRDQFVTKLESDINALEQDLNRVRARPGQTRDVDEIRGELKDLREQVASLRDVNEENWWEKTQDRFDRTLNRVEQSVENLGDRAQGETPRMQNPNENRTETTGQPKP